MPTWVVLFDWAADWGIFAGVAALLAVFITSMALFFSAERSNEHYKRILAEQSSSVRVFIMDLAHDEVRYFNVVDIREMHRCTVAEFYAKFPVAEQKRVINWINAVADPTTQAPDYLEVDIQESHTRRHYFSMLQVESVNHERQIIHLQSYLLKYMGTSTNPNGNGVVATGLSTMKEVEDAIAANGLRRGITLAFRFAHKRIAEKDRDIEPLVFNQFKNVLSPFLTPKRYLMQASGSELILCDLRVDAKAKGIYLIRSCLIAVNRYLSLNGLASTYDVRVGACEHRLFDQQPDKIIETARRLAVEAFADKASTLWYDRGRKSFNPNSDSSYRTEVERIINEKRLRYKFRPVLAVSQGEIMGYFAKAEPADSFFDSLDELKDYAERTEDDRNLAHTIAKETIQRFVSERPDDKQVLFYDVRYTEKNYLLLIFARLTNARNAHLIFVFDESDLVNRCAQIDDDGIIGDMRAIKAKGYEVALRLSSSQLQLESKIYAAFDYFVCSFAFENAAVEGSSTRLRSHLHAIVERLLKYQKPIIAADFEGWPAVELMVRSGLEYISSEAFAPFDVMMNPVNPKIIKRVKDMKN